VNLSCFDCIEVQSEFWDWVRVGLSRFKSRSKQAEQLIIIFLIWLKLNLIRSS
jgi:hypothetical protein